MTTTLVVGATGATGRQVVQMLLDQGQAVRAVVRSKTRLLEALSGQQESSFGDRLQIHEASLLDLPQTKLEELTLGCDAIVSCLGHTLDAQGMWGNPRRLVTDSVKRLTAAASGRTKFIVMSSSGVANPNGTDDSYPILDRFLLFLIRHLMNPHADNEQAALYLHTIGNPSSSGVEWCVVRPNDLLDGPVSAYELRRKRPSGSLFGAHTSTRANVAHAMVQLILNDEQWETWKYNMPVLINDAVEKK